MGVYLMGWIGRKSKYEKVNLNILKDFYKGSTKSIVCRKCGGAGSPLYNIGECSRCKGTGFERIPVKVFNDV